MKDHESETMFKESVKDHENKIMIHSIAYTSKSPFRYIFLFSAISLLDISFLRLLFVISLLNHSII